MGTSTNPLLQLTNHCWLIPGPTNIGIIEKAKDVYLIDSGNDKEAGRKILKLIQEKAWTLKGIINTHSNADHIGGNHYLQQMTNCEIWTSLGEASFINTPVIESSFLWGGYPFKELQTKFFEAKPSRVTRIIDCNTQEDTDWQFIPLAGHFFDQIGVLTGEKVFYMGDSIFGEAILEKYKIPYIYNVNAFKNSLETIKTIDAKYYVPSHGEVQTTIGALAEINIQKANDIEEKLMETIHEKKTFEDILQEMSIQYGIQLNFGQYALVGNTVRSFLSYLYNEGKAKYDFKDNKMYWQRLV
ncbi:MAG TPA: MBL fold metallo-hydrolase [Firmicutes bacterium]|jgi:glyoxylase-like metal-dependent hydrolase (beta-lactamase superfamily II)|nr:MBL fold metallo-hydrolase [Bacillota bacterium]